MSDHQDPAAAKRAAEQAAVRAAAQSERRGTLIFGAIACAVIVALIAGLMAVEIYGERMDEGRIPPANAADR
ncbi:hypothetical protein [Oryzomicrobium sp.]|uniref:hypothetical protein n=1 Tax=Oryzomicrobium sp. TaxID=1911578 RepID=UPI002FE0D00D